MEGAYAQITFLYYAQIEPPAIFYEQTMRLELVENQPWAKIYRVSGNAYLGIVAGDKGFHQPQEKNAVLVTLVVDDVALWYSTLRERGANLLSDIQHRPDIGIQCFFLQDPGGYTLEVQQFLKPEQVELKPLKAMRGAGGFGNPYLLRSL